MCMLIVRKSQDQHVHRQGHQGHHRLVGLTCLGLTNRTNRRRFLLRHRRNRRPRLPVARARPGQKLHDRNRLRHRRLLQRLFRHHRSSLHLLPQQANRNRNRKGHLPLPNRQVKKGLQPHPLVLLQLPLKIIAGSGALIHLFRRHRLERQLLLLIG